MEDLKIGKVVNYLTVLSPITIQAKNRTHKGYLCKCKCGNISKVRGTALRFGSIISCGCYSIQRAKETHTTHGKSKSITYESWKNMRTRCNNPKCPEYHNYGGRGIKICERWDSFELFLEDMGERPSLDYSIDRFPNNDTGWYEPNNCRWATEPEQQRNRRNNSWLEYNGERKIKCDWAKYLGISVHTFYYYLRKSMSLAEIIEHLNKKKSERDLKIKEVLEIFNSKIGDTKISKLYNVSRSTVINIRSGITWSSVTGKKHRKIA